MRPNKELLIEEGVDTGIDNVIAHIQKVCADMLSSGAQH
jgi:hypothetical protein